MPHKKHRPAVAYPRRRRAEAREDHVEFLRSLGRKERDARSDAVVQGNTAFALDLYAELKGTGKNLFFSPYSISTALAMTYAGARGHTAEQMAASLHFPMDPKQLHDRFASLQAGLAAIQERGRIELRIANSLWPQIDYVLLKEFLSLAVETYGALVAPVDYRYPSAASEVINAWVEDETAGKITNLVSPSVLGSLTVLVLVNAIYFKGNWASQFDPASTRDAPFWVTPNEELAVPMMAQQRRFRYGETESLQVLELPYAGGSVSMIVLLPRDRDGLADLEAALTGDNLARWTGHLRERKILVCFPKLKMSQGFRLENALTSLGMGDAFGAADFSGMDGSKGLFISAVLHKAYIDLDEEGTEAAAATAVLAAMSVGPRPPTFRADHPFVFLIRENSTGSILFLGRVANPASKAG
jgi:serine protease inhibitor